MDHEAAKAALARAEGTAERTAAVSQALAQGMNLQEIEDYLDWLDNTRAPAAGPLPAGLLARFAAFISNWKNWGLGSRLSTDPSGMSHSRPSPPVKPR
jgi:hypothetical protein